MNLRYEQSAEVLAPYAEEAVRLFRQFHERAIADEAVTFKIVPKGALAKWHLSFAGEVRKTESGYDVLLEPAVLDCEDACALSSLVAHELAHVDTAYILQGTELQSEWHKIVDEGRAVLFEAYVGHFKYGKKFAAHVQELKDKYKRHAANLEEITNSAKAMMEAISPDIEIQAPRVFPLHSYWLGLELCHLLYLKYGGKYLEIAKERGVIAALNKNDPNEYIKNPGGLHKCINK